MAKDVKNCQACEDLTEYAPEFVANGVTTTVCNSLKNNTGFNPALSKLHEDCEDLTDANDCLVGNMVDEIERFDVCDWKAYARLLVSNLYNVLGAIICSMCGVWDNIKTIKTRITNILQALNELSTRVTKVEEGSCAGEFALKGKSLTLTEDMFHFGSGISFDGAASVASDVDLRLMAGTYRVQGSIRVKLDGNMSNYWGSLGFKTRAENGYLVPRATINSNGSPAGHATSFFATNPGNWIVCYIIFPKTLCPWATWFGRGVGNFQDGGVGQLTAAWANGDGSSNTLSGQWGTDSPSITVPEGYWGLKVGLANVVSWDNTTEDNDYCNCTFNIIGQYRSNPDKIECKD